MKRITEYIQRVFERYLPSPFTIAILLTLFTLVSAVLFTRPSEVSFLNYAGQVLSYWENGIWNKSLLVFAYQMMLILLLGHVLVLTPFFSGLIDRFTSLCRSTTDAAIIVGVTTMLVAFFNWGLGLIYGALLARKVGESFNKKGKPLNYPLIGAAAYSGLMIWHGGISGSAPIKINEAGHLRSLLPEGIPSSIIPERITFAETVFSMSNLLTTIAVMISVSILLYILSKDKTAEKSRLPDYSKPVKENTAENKKGLDHSPWIARIISLLILITFMIQYRGSLAELAITPNMINFLMLGLGIALHGSIGNFTGAVLHAIDDVSGILVQFPLYFGIMGIMQSSGMVSDISNFFIEHATAETLPIFTFLSAGLVNVFVPSGGGQWVLQGPIILEAALSLNVPLPKMIMALSYGDQITNMLQPFWALPLLSITGLKAKEILPYSLMTMLVGGTVFLVSLLVS